MNAIKVAMAVCALTTTTVQAAQPSLHCTNRTMEARCDGGQCSTMNEGFTPVQLTREGKRIELCAYSGCWEGKVSHRHEIGSNEFLLADLRDSEQGSAPADKVAVMLNQATRHAQVSFADFALVMECSR